MSYKDDHGRHLRDSIMNLGESYHQTHTDNKRSYKFKSVPIPRFLLGLIGVVFVMLGLFLMDSEFHLSVKFFAFALFGSGIVISLQLLAAIASGLTGIIHRRLNRRRLRNRKDKSSN